MTTLSDTLSLKVAASPRLRHLVADRIRDAIANNTLKPGTRLIERELCEMTGVSRTSIREALRELESEGLVTTAGGKPIVAVLDEQEINDIYEVRMMLESLAARLFARRADDQQLERLRAITVELDDALADFAPEKFLRLKSEFYEVLFDGAGNEVAASMLRTIHIKVTLLRASSLQASERGVASMQELHDMVDAIIRRDEDAAAAISMLHMANALKAVLKARWASRPPEL